jgi:DNA cross-link repair 1A protein
MFRNPRQPAGQAVSHSVLKPSMGRPPTPSSTPKGFRDPSTNISKTISTLATPVLGRSKAVQKTNGRPLTFSGGKIKSKPNGSILSFFKKASTTTPCHVQSDLYESLFVEDDESPKSQEAVQFETPMGHDSAGSFPETSRISYKETALRFNEEPGSIKRQRIESPSIPSPSTLERNASNIMRIGPFFEDSDDDDEIMIKFGKGCQEDVAEPQSVPSIEPYKKLSVEETATKLEVARFQTIPLITHESSKIEEENGFENMEDIDDEFPEEGEEYLERRWMEEQGEIELGIDDADPEDHSKTKLRDTTDSVVQVYPEPSTPACPICEMSFDGLTSEV